MDKGSEGHGPRCMICQRFFTPDPRQGDRQRCCGRQCCRQQYKNLWQRKKYASDLPGARDAVRVRVRRHRWNTGGKKRPGNGSAAEHPRISELSDVAEAVISLEATVNGLAARATNCCDGHELRRILAECAEHGKQMLHVQHPPRKKLAVTGHVPEAEWGCNGTRSRASDQPL